MFINFPHPTTMRYVMKNCNIFGATSCHTKKANIFLSFKTFSKISNWEKVIVINSKTHNFEFYY